VVAEIDVFGTCMRYGVICQCNCALPVSE
jgi:hypothetical protein